jgi:hypothetical protein
MAIGLFLLLLVLAAPADEESSSWTQEQIDRLPHWGTFEASSNSAPDELTFKIGEHFQNADLRGRVTLQNSTSSEIVVGTIDTDCNCTAAFVKERTIPSGEKRSVLIRVDSAEVGERSVKLAVQMNGQVHIGFINVRIRPTFTVAGHAEFIEGKPAEICVDVKDPKVAPSDVQFQSTRSDIKVLKTTVGERQLKVSVQWDGEGVCPHVFTLLPMVAGNASDGISVPARMPGRCEAIPKTVYVSDPEQSLRIFVRGDIPDTKPTKLELRVNEQEIVIKEWEFEHKGQLAILTFLNPFQSFASGTYSVKGRMEDAEFQFNVAISDSNGG